MAKEEAMTAHAAAVVTADEALYQAGFSDGVASVPPVIATPDVQAQIDAAVASAQSALQPQIDALKSSLSDDDKKLADMTTLEQSVQEKLDKIKQLLA